MQVTAYVYSCLADTNVFTSSDMHVNWRLYVPHKLIETSEAQLCCLGLESHLRYQEEMLCVESMPQISLYHIPERENWVVV